ncbi:rab-like protein 2A [Convolutriloba macropyga]|uniref:rab-like protein 2A n=1 Tax=Convolutriloba macropyga TaxID=536237 RepID=UPI003F527902
MVEEKEGGGSGGVMASDATDAFDAANAEHPYLKIIILGDSAVGKSKLFDRFHLNDYKEYRYSTYALTLYRHKVDLDGQERLIHFWDTAGQEIFNSMHPSYYFQAHACIMVFDVLRKVTYKNLTMWHEELCQHRPDIPVLLVANKIDANPKASQMKFNMASKYNMKLYYCSASDGTNVVKVFKDAIVAAHEYKKKTTDFMDAVMEELQLMDEDGDA